MSRISFQAGRLHWDGLSKGVIASRPESFWQRGSDEWQAPRALFAFLDRFFRFGVDVCASAQNAKCRQFFSKDQSGLSKTWRAGHYVAIPVPDR